MEDWNETEVSDLEEEYLLLGELGRGGSAVVYRARERALGRDVAIKVVRPRPAAGGDDAVERLVREARTVAKLQHPNIVTVYAVKRLRDGGYALVMQLIPGRTLKQTIVDEGQFTAEQAERVIVDVAHALAFAHKHGVVHRDVKPENIFIEAATGRALLSDFGIAHSTEFDSRLTMTGAAIGTPAYMSPEQIDGAPANARSDVYSLGLVAWEMLTGERPWEGETLYNVIFKQKHSDLQAIDEIRPGEVPPRLQYIVERMLQKKPAARWAGAEGLLLSLTNWVVPADWQQWLNAHQRRRDQSKSGSKSKSAPQNISGQATVRFARPSSQPQTPEEEAAFLQLELERRALTPAFGEVVVSENDDLPSWAHEEIVPKRNWRPVLIASVSVLVAALVGTGYAVQTGKLDLTHMLSTRAANGATVSPPPAVASLPTIPLGGAGVDSQSMARADSVMLARRNDSLRAVGIQPVAPGAVAATGPDRPAAANTNILAADTAAAVRRKQRADSIAKANAIAAAAAVAVVPPPKSTEPPATLVRSTDDRGIIAAGGRHSCTLGGGRVFCWGANERGQLGDGGSESRDLPAGIAADIEFVQVSAGYAHSCGVARNGDAYCWGSGDRGQLGDATSTSRNAPVRVAGSLSFQIVRTGLTHTCGLTTAGDVACWGANDRGQLGDGTVAPHSSPVTIRVSARFVGLTVGWNHSCAISGDGGVYCWGDNAAGQLGDGTKTERHSPTQVNSDVRFTSIGAGSGHTCAVSDGGEAWCWGSNKFGQLGFGGNTDQSTPSKVDTPTRFASVSLGSVHSCGRTRAGQAWCWGRNVYGQLGDGTTTNRDTPVRVVGAATFSAVSATGAHTCGVSTDGETSCWGFNTEGQLGDGSRENHSRPTRVTLPSH